MFDLDGTIMSTNVIEQYLWTRLPELSRARQVVEVGEVLGRLPGYLLTEQRDRGSFLRAVYRRYRGIDLAELEHRVDTTHDRLHPRAGVSPDAIRRIEEHRAAGHTTILITGAVVRPDPSAARPLRRDRRRRARGRRRRQAHRLPRHLAAGRGVPRRRGCSTTPSLHGVDLKREFAYADCHSDLPMLSTVGNPVAVSPDISLMRAAQRKKWSIVEWKTASPAPRWRLPR